MNTFTFDDTATLRRYAAERSLSLRWGETDQGDEWAILGDEAPTTITREGGGYTALDENGAPLASVDTLSVALN
jgi:hypothetical protein